MQNTAYRLADYKVIENNHGDLWWETHIGLGSLKGGKCFINEDILFIEPSDITGPGFLKGEFLDHLNKLPKWERTQYFCPSYVIYYSNTGAICRSLEEEKDLNRTGTKYVVVDRKANDGGINIKPVIVNKGDPKEKLKAFLNFCKILMILILRILFKCFQMIFTGIRFLIGKLNRFRG